MGRIKSIYGNTQALYVTVIKTPGRLKQPGAKREY